MKFSDCGKYIICETMRYIERQRHNKQINYTQDRSFLLAHNTLLHGSTLQGYFVFVWIETCASIQKNLHTVPLNVDTWDHANSKETSPFQKLHNHIARIENDLFLSDPGSPNAVREDLHCLREGEGEGGESVHEHISTSLTVKHSSVLVQLVE